MKRIEVVGAVIVRDDLVLCAKRATGDLAGHWEFPGGKIELGETPEQALRREIDEELGVDVVVGERITTTSHEYTFGLVVLTTFYCAVERGDVAAREHAELRWVPREELERLPGRPPIGRLFG